MLWRVNDLLQLYNNGLELAFHGLAYKTTDGHNHDTRQPAFQKTHTAGGAPTRDDDTHAVARSPRRMRADEPAVSGYYMRFLTSDACSTRIYHCYPPNPTDEAVVWLCPQLPMPMHGLRHIADQLHLHHGFVTVLSRSYVRTCHSNGQDAQAYR
jgi:hypothetical protein